MYPYIWYNGTHEGHFYCFFAFCRAPHTQCARNLVHIAYYSRLWYIFRYSREQMLSLFL